MEFKTITLDNGLKLIGECAPSAASMALGFFTRTGSRDEADNIHGVSHFLEHMMFKGTARRSAMEVNLEFDQMGAMYNAFTSEENTVYYGAVLPEFQAKIVDLLADILRPALRQDDFDMEKNVILEEMALYEDRPEFRLYEKLMQQYFADHPLGRTILGTQDSIKNLKRDDMLEYFSRRYSPSNMVAVATGNVDWDALVDQVSSACGKWQQFEADRQLPAQQSPKTSTHIFDENLQRYHTGFAAPAPSWQSDQRHAAMLAAAILGDSESGRLYYELVEPAMADDASMIFDAMDSTGTMLTFITTDPANAEKASKLAKSVFENFAADGPGEDELQAAKNKLASSAVISSEIPMGRLTAVGFEWTYSQKYTPMAQQIEEMMAVTPQQCRHAVNDFNIMDITTVTLGPTEN